VRRTGCSMFSGTRCSAGDDGWCVQGVCSCPCLRADYLGNHVRRVLKELGQTYDYQGSCYWVLSRRCPWHCRPDSPDYNSAIVADGTILIDRNVTTLSPMKTIDGNSLLTNQVAHV